MENMEGFKLPTITPALKEAMNIHKETFFSITEEYPVLMGPNPYGGYGGEFTIQLPGGRLVGGFGVRELPGCCGVVVFYHSFINTPFRRKGLGRLFLQIRTTAAELAGYSLIQATVLTTNHVERKLLTTNNWMELVRVRNSRTGNKVGVFFKWLT